MKERITFDGKHGTARGEEGGRKEQKKGRSGRTDGRAQAKRNAAARTGPHEEYGKDGGGIAEPRG